MKQKILPFPRENLQSTMCIRYCNYRDLTLHTAFLYALDNADARLGSVAALWSQCECRKWATINAGLPWAQIWFRLQTDHHSQLCPQCLLPGMCHKNIIIMRVHLNYTQWLEIPSPIHVSSSFPLQALLTLSYIYVLLPHPRSVMSPFWLSQNHVSIWTC